MDPLENSLRDIESRLRKMASEWLEVGNPALKNSSVPSHNTCNLTGKDLDDEKLRFVKKKLAALRRMAKINHPRYDVNLHIHLKTELLRLEGIRASPN